MQALVRTRLNFFSFYNNLKRFVASKGMLPIWVCFVLVCHIFALETLALTVFTLFIIFVSVTNTKIQAILPPLVMAILPTSNTYPDLLQNPYIVARLWYIIVCASLMFVALIIAFVKRKLSFKPSWGFLGMMLLGLLMLLGGLMSPSYNFLNLAGGAMISAIFITLYIVFAFIAKEIDFDYIAHVFIAMSIVVLIQLFMLFLVNDIMYYMLYGTFATIKRQINLGWGISNLIATMLAVGIPFSVYLMTKHKNPIFMFVIFVFQTVGVMMTLSRAMMIFAVPFAFIGIVYAIIRCNKRGRWQLAVGSGIVLIVTIIFVQWQWEQVLEFVGILGDGRGRDDLYIDAWEAFLRNPVFGAGVAYRLNDPLRMTPLMLVHNTVLQFMMWGGIFGLVAFLLHSIQVLATCFYKPNEKKIILLFAFGMIYAQSMLDVMMFFPQTLFYYILFMVLLDADAAKNKGFSMIGKEDKKAYIKQYHTSYTIYGNNFDVNEGLPCVLKKAFSLF